MCGRFTLQTNLAQFFESFFNEPVVDAPAENAAAYNIAPTQKIWTVARDTQRRLHCLQMNWGLVPPWSDDKSIGSKMINARSETVLEKPSYKKVIQTQRCLIPADGYYEWQTLGKHKQPYWIHRSDQQPLMFAGIWQQNTRIVSETERPFISNSILTMAAIDSMRHLHERTPIMLTDAATCLQWLDAVSIDEVRLAKFCKSIIDQPLNIRKVLSKVGNVRNQGPGLIEPLED